MSAPYSAQVAASDQVRVIRASAPNHVSVTRQVAFDQTQEIVLQLEQVQSQRRPKTRVKVDPQPSVTVPVTSSEPAPGSAMSPPVKRPRALDGDNPFAG
jgi:hypothetical protein